MFLTQEKVLRKVIQDREKGDLERALRRAVEGLERWPGDWDIAIEAIQLCLDLSDFKQAVTLMKSAIRRHAGRKTQVLAIAREALHQQFNPFLASFVVDSELRGGDVESARDILRIGTQSYIDDMIKRSKTRSKGFEEGGRRDSPGYFENELLLGLLHIEAGNLREAVEPLGKSLAGYGRDPRAVGGIIVELERELPSDAVLQFYLGVASRMLSHYDKAEARFFRSLELADPPAERIVLEAGAEEWASRDSLMLIGEASLAAGDLETAKTSIERYLSGEDGDPGSTGFEEAAGGGPPDGERAKRFAFGRLERRKDDISRDTGLTVIFASLAAELDLAGPAVEALEARFEECPSCAGELAARIGDCAGIASTAPGRVLMMDLGVSIGDIDMVESSARLAAEIDRNRIPSILETLSTAGEEGSLDRARILSLKAEIYARAGNSGRAAEILEELDREGSVSREELMRLSGEVLTRCGVDLDGVSTNVELGMRSGDIEQAARFVTEFYRSNPDAHEELCARIAAAAGGFENGWEMAAGICESLKAEEQADRPLRRLLAEAHLHIGEIERAVFEFDQLMMFDEELHDELIPVYERAAEENPGNTTLHLALYQLYFDGQDPVPAAHHLARALESDQGQIRDIIPRFEKITDMDPANRAVWEEMIRSALSLEHYDLAEEILGRATPSLSPDDAAAMRIYGARISAAKNDLEGGIECVSDALASPGADLAAVREEIESILAENPQSAEAEFLMGRTMIRMGDEGRAVEALERCLDISPEHAGRVGELLENLLPVSAHPWMISRVLAGIAWREGRPEDSFRLLEASMRGPDDSLPGLAEALETMSGEGSGRDRIDTIRSEVMVRTGRFDEAVRLLESLVSRDPSASPAAAGELEKLVWKEPGHLEARALLARLRIDSEEIEGSLDVLLPPAADREADPAKVLEMLERFYGVHGGDCRFLTATGGLRGRTGDLEGSLAELGKALESGADPAAVLSGIEAIEWSGDVRPGALLLEADCLMALGEHDRAFPLLERISGGGEIPAAEVMGRALETARGTGNAKHYVLAAGIAAGSGDAAEAERIISEGIESADPSGAVDLTISLAGMMRDLGMEERAASLLAGVLDGAPDRRDIYRRIEEASLSRSSRLIEEGISRMESGEAGEADTESAARAAIEAGELESAARMIDGGPLSAPVRSILLARMHMAKDSPVMALAALRSCAPGGLDGETLLERLYLEGIASERTGDHGRAAAAFSRILGIRAGYMDRLERASREYSSYLSTADGEEVPVLQVTGSLEP